MSPQATTSDDRRRLIVEAIVAHRRGGGDPVVFEGAESRIKYDDRRLRLELDDDERGRLEALLSAYHVFKIKQPDTRKADDGVVYLSAVTDPKHAADFVESLFRDLYDADAGYELRIE
ncbi:MAG: hypothetical protein ACOCQM_03315 [Natronomonas sp.]